MSCGSYRGRGGSESRGRGGCRYGGLGGLCTFCAAPKREYSVAGRMLVAVICSLVVWSIRFLECRIWI